jgi:hypothetical protein
LYYFASLNITGNITKKTKGMAGTGPAQLF